MREKLDGLLQWAHRVARQRDRTLLASGPPPHKGTTTDSSSSGRLFCRPLARTLGFTQVERGADPPRGRHCSWERHSFFTASSSLLWPRASGWLPVIGGHERCCSLGTPVKHFYQAPSQVWTRGVSYSDSARTLPRGCCAKGRA